ncbi:cationic amino acid transporter 1-like protein, partial [Tanacetum coccineum]
MMAGTCPPCTPLLCIWCHHKRHPQQAHFLLSNHTCFIKLHSRILGLLEDGWIGYCITVPIWAAAMVSLWAVPLVPWLPSASIAINIFLLGSIDRDSFIRFVGWTGLLFV